MIPKLPAKAKGIIDVVRREGSLAYLVGGALRDLMMGRAPHDWDFAATLPPEELLRVFPGARLVGGSCGTVQVPMGEGMCEVTPCRTEEGYSDKRHPDRVDFVPDILADLSRRDFTVNAMAYDGQILIDPFGGQRDLRKTLLRCVGDPEKRFEEDPLRILRMYRFIAELGFSVDWGTYGAANRGVGMVGTLSRERVRDEVERMLFSSGPQVLGSLVSKGGLKAYGFSFAPALTQLADLPEDPLCRWWAFISLCGAGIPKAGEAFGFSKRFVEDLREMSRLYMLGPSHDKLTMKQKLRGTRLEYEKVAQVFAAVSPTFAGEPVLFQAVRISGEAYRIEDLAINGADLAEEGITGTDCGRVLDELLSAVIQNPALNRSGVLRKLARNLHEAEREAGT